MLDLNSIQDDVTDKWLPLVGRTLDEKVTGDVHIVVTRGTMEWVLSSAFHYSLQVLTGAYLVTKS